jgi:hypothetical protein
VLGKGVSVVVGASQWKTQKYAVRRAYINDILMRLECGQPNVDAFANSTNKRWEFHWGPRSQREDAFDVYWNYDAVGLIWANPPFSELDRVIAKAHRDGAKMVLIAPDWKSTAYYKKMWPTCQAVPLLQPRYRVL